MPDACERITLTKTEAACLDALRRGFEGKTRIALAVGQDLKTVAKALDALRRANLIVRVGRSGWRTTEEAGRCVADVVPDPARRRGGKQFGRLVPGSTAVRLLESLDRPMRGADLVDCLGVSRQRIHQLVIKLHAQGRLRFADDDAVLHVVARVDDSTVLLGRDEERILSALPDDAPTTVPKLTARTHMTVERATVSLVGLREKGLIEPAGASRGGVLYRLTLEGRRHFQRRASADRAEPAPLKVKSDRVWQVRSYIADRGTARIRDVSNDLGIPGQSMNALMQYFKRRGLVEKVGSELKGPYALTTEGAETLREMVRRTRA